MQYESVIGLEVHVQIKTESKLFCSCSTVFGAPPNTNICPICCGYPGVLPVTNKKAVELLVKTALALHCKINHESIFARKQYFYPDLPKNYQISQYEKPLAEHGFLEMDRRQVRILRIHLEEDAGKLLHTIGAVELDCSLVDLNRTGVPLMEIVTEPDLDSPQSAYEYLSNLKTALQYLQVSDCDMEKGSLRCDANISIREKGRTTLGTKVEIKNMNSFRGVEEALEYEFSRQERSLNEGKRIVQETRLWDPDKKESRPMRSKEEAHDYRYFPEPDLLPLIVPDEWISSIRSRIPEMPLEKRSRMMKDYDLTDYDARVLTQDFNLCEYYEKAFRKIKNSKTNASCSKLLSNWITTELLGRLNAANQSIASSPISSEQMAELMDLILDETISGKIAKTVFEQMWKTGKNAQTIVAEQNLVQVLDQKEIEKWALEAIAKNQKAVDEYKSGKEKALGALVGAVMKLSKGQANPQLVNQILKEKLS